MNWSAARAFDLMADLLPWEQVLLYKRSTWDILRDKDLGIRNFTSIFLDILQSSFVDLAELRPLFLELNIKKRMFLAEVQRVVFAMRSISGHRMRDIMPQFRGVLVMMIVVMVDFVMIIMMGNWIIMFVTLFSHDKKI